MNPSTLIDIANVVFFLANLPQLILAIRNRKNLASLSSIMLFGMMTSMLLLGIGNYLFGAYIATALIAFNFVFYMLQLYWKLRYK